MKPPTLDQIADYASSLNYDGFDAEAMFDHYEMVGWVYGKSRKPIKDWKAAVRQWRRNDLKYAADRPRPRAQLDDQAIKDYVIQLRVLRSGDNQDEAIVRLYRKIRDTLGPEGLAQVKSRA